MPDDIVIEKRGKGDAFIECTGADVKISSMKLIQHDAVEGILSEFLKLLVLLILLHILLMNWDEIYWIALLHGAQ